MEIKKPLTSAEINELIEKDDLTTLEEGGKYEVKEIKGKHKGLDYKVVIRADYNLLSKSYGELLKVDSSGAVEMDLIGAGNKLLFMGAVYGRENVMSKAALQVKVSQNLGLWLSEIMGDGEEEAEQKKS